MDSGGHYKRRNGGFCVTVGLLMACSRLSSSEVHFLIEIGRFAFSRPPLGDLGATYDDRLRLIGKRVVDFLLALIELFFARCYG